MRWLDQIPNWLKFGSRVLNAPAFTFQLTVYRKLIDGVSASPNQK